MKIDRVQFQDIVASQLPRYVREDFPLLEEFLQQYYISQEYQGGVLDLVQNLDQYVKLDNLFALKNSTILETDLDYVSQTINSSASGNFTEGFPDKNGLLKIDNEIISYDYKTDTTFEGCVRGFSGITTYVGSNSPDQLVFTETEADKHKSGAVIYNLNILFLQEFFKKLKNQFVPGFTERTLYSGLDQRNFVQNADSFYQSKGTDNAFKILFKALYGEDVNVIRPSQQLFRPSDAFYSVTQDFVVEQIVGDPLQLKNLTLYQDSTNSRGTVTNVERILYDQGQYYQISIDYGYQRDIDTNGTIFGKFEPNPKTKILSPVSIGATFIDVDSTVGFAKTGYLVTKNIDGDDITIVYGNKNYTQFLDVSEVFESISEKTDIREDSYSYGYVGFDTSQQIRVRMTSSLTELKLDGKTNYYNKGDTISLQSLGYEDQQTRSRNWKFNTKTEWDVESIKLVDATENAYEIQTFDDQLLNPQYKIRLKSSVGSITDGTIYKIISKTKFVARFSRTVDTRLVYSVENQLLKGNSTRYPVLGNYFANVQNTYSKFNGNVLLTSNSIPFYGDTQINPYDKKITFSGSSSDGETIKLTNTSDHGFFTGDAVYYQPGIVRTTTTTPDGVDVVTETINSFDNISAAVLYVKRVDENNIKLSRSRADLFSNKFLNLVGNVEDNKFIYYDFYQKDLTAQSIVREIDAPSKKVGNFETNSGFVGTLVNGVEILNYKSNNQIYYGDLEGIDIASGGLAYGVINPPVLNISDSVGTGATGVVSVDGSLSRVDIIDTGFDYQETPVVKITGGNPEVNAVAEVRMTPVTHSNSFNAELIARQVSVTSDTIGFGSYHKFAPNEQVVYRPNKETVISGLSTDALYYVSIVDDLTIKLHNTYSDANVGINTVNLISFGTGIQEIESVKKKRVVTGVEVVERGRGYKNKQRFFTSSGVSTSLNRININNHGYNNKEIIKYDAGSTGVVGLSTNKEYFVVKVDNNNFSLCEVGTGSTSTDYFFNNGILVDFDSTGSGSFNYLPIKVTIEGVIGISTTSTRDFNAKVQPIFTGSIDSIQLTNNGVGYGSSEILNFNRIPTVTLESGEGALVRPIISNGRIVDVIIDSNGHQYNSPPVLLISGKGTHAKLTPIVDNGRLVEVKIINGGIGYDNTTSIGVISSGYDAKLTPEIHKWTINLVSRNFPIINNDDGFVEENNSRNSLEYCHAYAPRQLRENTYSLNSDGQTAYGVPDLLTQDGNEIVSSNHSPILGWAYDGNPIYGPYGYSTREGGIIRQMLSGYALTGSTTNRPPLSLYPAGTFVEDYEFTGNGDLDEHNGKFGVTPDFPNGVYAYFATFNTSNETSGPFNKFRAPAFPYIIGNTFRNQPNLNNSSSLYNQNDYNVENDGWFRNTSFYHTNDAKSGYSYIFNSNQIKAQTLDIESAKTGNIDSVTVFSGGNNYQVGDRLVFNNNDTNGKDAQAKVQTVFGKTINTVSTSSSIFLGIEFSPYTNKNQFIGFSSVPHNLLDLDVVNVNGISEYFTGFDGTYQVGVRSDNFVLTLGVGTAGATGITTYFYVSGALEYPFIRENDILGIGTEQVKVLNVDKPSKRIRVLREQNGTVGSAYSNREILFEDPRKFNINVGSTKTTKTFRLNRELYFDPTESVGIGTTTGIGVGSTIVFSNPGVGKTQIFIEPQSIYIPDHRLSLNDKVSYNSNGGTVLTVWNGVTPSYSSIDDFDFFYVAPLSRDFIGIATNRVGLGTTGSYVGVNSEAGLLYFTDYGTGDHHSFKTDLLNVITGQVDKTSVTVSTASTHGLLKNDKINLTIKPTDTQTIIVKYNDYNRRIVFDPQDFSASDIDTKLNTIYFSDNIFRTGDRVVHTATSPAGGLIDNEMYYVIVYDRYRIRLVNDLYQINQLSPKFVDLTSQSSGTLSRINPLVETHRNNNLKFDLSDSSLSFILGGINYSAFDLNIYKSNNYSESFYTTETTNDFEVTKSGKVGIDSTANLTIRISDQVPTNLWYQFDLDNTNVIPVVKSQIVKDLTVPGNSEIDVVKTSYDGEHTISGIGSTTFEFSISQIPRVFEYNSTNSNSSYYTKSRTVYGPIRTVEVTNDGSGYRSLPSIPKVVSGFGTGAILYAESNEIGEVLLSRFNSDNIGFDYPTDKTLNFVANLPEVLSLESLTSFESIGITSSGRNYLTSPDLVVVDGYTNKVVTDLDIKYQLGDNQVSILQNTTGMYNVPPRIIPTNNSNGIGISSITYSSNIVRAYLNQTFSNASDFPFKVNGKVLVEDINIGIGTTGKGYNSSDYNYTLFTITGADGRIGGTGAYVEYTLKDVLNSGDIPGIIINATLGRVVPEEQFPIFKSVLKTNDFLEGETVISDGSKGIVESWKPNIEMLKISTPKEFVVGSVVKGLSSQTQAVIEKKFDYNAQINIGAGATVIDGWQRQTGFLNNDLQRIPNNEYYQNFSYSLSSRVDYDTWEDPVSALNHTSGFAKFADYQAESDSSLSGSDVIVSTVNSDVDIVVDIVGEVDLNCYSDFDNVTERTSYIGGNLVSSEIVFENKILTDYFQSVGNRVLSIDDFSDTFNSEERKTTYAQVLNGDENQTLNKVITFVNDQTFVNECQFEIISLLQNNGVGYLNAYGKLFPGSDLGTFDYLATSTGWSLVFYPFFYEYSSYDTSVLNFTILNDRNLETTHEIGNIVQQRGELTTVGAGTTTVITTIDSNTYNFAKVITMLDFNGNDYSTVEFNIVSDGSEVYALEYGLLQNNFGIIDSDFGSYSVEMNGTDVEVKFTSNVGSALTSKTFITSVSGIGTTTGIDSLDVSKLSSNYVSIAASTSPSAIEIVALNDPFKAGYHIVCVTDTTNSEYEMFEVGTIQSDLGENFVEFANVRSGASLGQVGMTTNSLVYTPEANIDVEVRVYANELKIFDLNENPNSIDIGFDRIDSNSSTYRGTKLDLTTAFGLKHEGLEIFRRSFDGSNSGIVSTTDNVVKINNHFFVTGEQVVYSHAGAGTSQAIGIATTTVTGIGLTDKLPNNLFVVAVDSGKLKFSNTAQDALKTEPVTFDITSVGIGTSHSITSTNANAKALIAIDNMIQSPLSDTDVETTLTASVNFDLNFPVAGVTSFKAADIIKIDDEIMRVVDVGVQGPNYMTVRRAQVGTLIAAHTGGSTVTKLSGNYNIIGNTLNFVEAPYGNVPLSTTTGDPDYRDWTGITTHSTFQGRTFMRSGQPNTSQSTYSSNYVFDDISSQFTGVTSVFTLQSGGSNTVGFSTFNAMILVNGIFQEPQGVQVGQGQYQISETSGISSLRFYGTGSDIGYDPNRTDLPIGGYIVSVGSSEGFGYQPLVSAGGTAVVSGLGTISSISIGYSGSGYRAGIQTVVNVGVQTYSDGIPNIEFIGTAAISGGNIVSVAITNPGSGYTSTNPPEVIFDDPLSYSNIELIYSSSSVVGNGQSATVDIVVGQGSSVINFELRQTGFSYKNGDILTFAVGGDSGIPTDTSKPFSEFQLTVESVFSDSFNGWSVGELEVLDNFNSKFDGSTKSFRLSINDQPVSIQKATGSNVDLEQTLLIFINDILQEPGNSFFFNGGSTVEFVEAPESGDTSKVLFYKGSGDIDVVFTNILETIKIGDTVDINNNPSRGQGIALDQDPRNVTGINTIDTIQTNTYVGPGITSDTTIVRPVTWCKQSVDKVINGKQIGKNRNEYEPNIYPSSFLIQPVSVGATVIYVDNAVVGFNPENESQVRDFQNYIDVTSQDSIVGASATAVVSGLGTISSIVISNSGIGYSSVPEISIASPLGITTRATATSTISGGSVSSITIVNPGSGYTSTNPPQVLIETPKTITEKVTVDSYEGDYGLLVGFGATTIGSQNQLIFDFFIPTDSYLRDNTYVGTAKTVSGITTGDFFTVYNSNVTNVDTLTSEYSSGGILGITTQNADCVYQVTQAYSLETNVVGLGTTTVRRIFTNVGSIGTETFSSTLITFDSTTYTFDSRVFTVYAGGITTAFNFGNFSWGKIFFEDSIDNEFYSYTRNSYTGISTSGLVQRFNPLKFTDYTS